MLHEDHRYYVGSILNRKHARFEGKLRRGAGGTATTIATTTIDATTITAGIITVITTTLWYR